MLFMGLDVGTTGTKACVFSPEGQLLGYGFEEYSVYCPKPGYAEKVNSNFLFLFILFEYSLILPFPYSIH